MEVEKRGEGRRNNRERRSERGNERLIFLPLDWQLAGQKPFTLPLTSLPAPLPLFSPIYSLTTKLHGALCPKEREGEEAEAAVGEKPESN